MFGKDQKERGPEAPAPAPPEKSGRNSGVNTVLGPGAKYTGKLEASGSVQIDGEFDGELDVKGTLLVGRDGKVKSKTVARDVVVHGWLEGDINASVKVELMAGSTFVGSVRAPSFTIQEKAVFEGTCKMPGKVAGGEKK
ncbi:MAG: polymer-forming cytoskeletal protein [Candidatus Eisenbacteria bacterium]